MKLLSWRYKQPNAWTCGPAVVRIVLDYFGLKKEIYVLCKDLKTTHNGTRSSDLIKYLQREGFWATAQRNASLAKLRKTVKTNLVLVSYWLPRSKESHFSIVKRLDSKKIYFHDTWFGQNHSYHISYFLKNWRDENYSRWMVKIKK